MPVTMSCARELELSRLVVPGTISPNPIVEYVTKQKYVASMKFQSSHTANSAAPKNVNAIQKAN